jgi:hypothetical protein
MKRTLLLGLIIFAINSLQAQFSKGTRMLNGNGNFDFSNNKSSSEDITGLKQRNETENNMFGYGLQLGYGKFRKENKVLVYSLGYSFVSNETNSNKIDSIKTGIYYSKGTTNSYLIFIENLNFLPIKNNWGILYSIKSSVGYNLSENNTTTTTKFIANDSNVLNKSSYITNYFQVSAFGNLGVYYCLNKKFLLFSQLNLCGVNLNFNTSTTNSSSNKSENTSFSFNLTGALTPTFKLGDISIGLKYLIYKQ